MTRLMRKSKIKNGIFDEKRFARFKTLICKELSVIQKNSLQDVVCQVFASGEKRSDVVWIMSDINFPTSYVVFSTSDIVFRTSDAVSQMWGAAAFALVWCGAHCLYFALLCIHHVEKQG